MDDVVAIPGAGGFSQSDQYLGRPAMPMLVVKNCRRRGGVSRSIVMGEHDIHVSAGGDETHLMVIFQPCARSQKRRQQSRVARCKSEQQD